MKVTYTGKLEPLHPDQKKNLQGRFDKLGKFLDGKGEKTAHVILNLKRGIHAAEITVNYLNHSFVALGSEADQYQAVTGALNKLEKQVIRVKQKRRDGKQRPAVRNTSPAEAVALANQAEAESPAQRASSNGKRPRVFRVDPNADRKPMSLEEAMLEIGKDGGYVVYRDAKSDRLSVLLRRPDGHLDLIES